MNPDDTLNRGGDLTCAIFGGLGVDKAAELDDAVHGSHLDFARLHVGIFNQMALTFAVISASRPYWLALSW